MDQNLIFGLLSPFIGTTLGAACVFLLKNGLNEKVQRAMTGFAAGVMVAASVWSLLIPSLDHASHMGTFAFVPAVIGFLVGMLFLLVLDQVTPHLHRNCDQPEGPKCRMKNDTMMLLAVTLHNIPEGMAIGVVFAGYLNGEANISSAAAIALALGIAIQNFPEGAIVSMPLASNGKKKGKAFFSGLLSGAVEPVAAVLTILAAELVIPALPYLLSFAAGAMIYVVVEELIPEMSEGNHSNLGTITFALGFALMMILDVALG